MRRGMKPNSLSSLYTKFPSESISFRKVHGFLKVWVSGSFVHGFRGLAGFFPFFTESSVLSVRSVYRNWFLSSDNEKTIAKFYQGGRVLFAKALKYQGFYKAILPYPCIRSHSLWTTDYERWTIVFGLLSMVIPEVFPIPRVDRPSLFARARIPFPVWRLRLASQMDSPTA